MRSLVMDHIHCRKNAQNGTSFYTNNGTKIVVIPYKKQTTVVAPKSVQQSISPSENKRTVPQIQEVFAILALTSVNESSQVSGATNLTTQIVTSEQNSLLYSSPEDEQQCQCENKKEGISILWPILFLMVGIIGFYLLIKFFIIG